MLGCTSLGTILFYVLDGDNRKNDPNGPGYSLLVGSRFLHNHRACISYEHLSLFLMKPTGEVTSSPLERTRTGHLVLDPFSGADQLDVFEEAG